MSTAYDRDLLRTQMELLRGAADRRARAEREIVVEHETETEQAVAEAQAALEAIAAKYSAEIAATKKEYATVLARTQAAGEAEQKKLEQQRAIWHRDCPDAELLEGGGPARLAVGLLVLVRLGPVQPAIGRKLRRWPGQHELKHEARAHR